MKDYFINQVAHLYLNSAMSFLTFMMLIVYLSIKRQINQDRKNGMS